MGHTIAVDSKEPAWSVLSELLGLGVDRLQLSIMPRAANFLEAKIEGEFDVSKLASLQNQQPYLKVTSSEDGFIEISSDKGTEILKKLAEHHNRLHSKAAGSASVVKADAASPSVAQGGALPVLSARGFRPANVGPGMDAAPAASKLSSAGFYRRDVRGAGHPEK